MCSSRQGLPLVAASDAAAAVSAVEETLRTLLITCTQNKPSQRLTWGQYTHARTRARARTSLCNFQQLSHPLCKCTAPRSVTAKITASASWANMRCRLLLLVALPQKRNSKYINVAIPVNQSLGLCVNSPALICFSGGNCYTTARHNAATHSCFLNRKVTSLN